jgi:hypothetical protein
VNLQHQNQPIIEVEAENPNGIEIFPDLFIIGEDGIEALSLMITL